MEGRDYSQLKDLISDRAKWIQDEKDCLSLLVTAEDWKKRKKIVEMYFFILIPFLL